MDGGLRILKSAIQVADPFELHRPNRRHPLSSLSPPPDRWRCSHHLSARKSCLVGRRSGILRLASSSSFCRLECNEDPEREREKRVDQLQWLLRWFEDGFEMNWESDSDGQKLRGVRRVSWSRWSGWASSFDFRTSSRPNSSFQGESSRIQCKTMKNWTVTSIDLPLAAPWRRSRSPRSETRCSSSYTTFLVKSPIRFDFKGAKDRPISIPSSVYLI